MGVVTGCIMQIEISHHALLNKLLERKTAQEFDLFPLRQLDRQSQHQLSSRSRIALRL